MVPRDPVNSPHTLPADRAEYAMAEALPQLVWTTDAQGLLDFVNQRWVAATGLSLEQSRGWGCADALHPHDSDRVRATWARAVETGQPYDVEYRLRQPDGTYRWYLARGVPVADDTGAIRRWIGTCTDITGREFHESEERFRATFEHAAIGLAHLTPDGRWIRVNQRLCDIVGYGRDDLVQGTIQDITHPDDVALDRDLARALLAGTIPTYSLEKRLRHRDGQSVWVTLTASLVRGPHGEPKYVIAAVADIAARKQAEEALRDSQAQLQLFIENAPAAIAMFDRQMRYIAVSHQWLRDFRLGDDVIGRSHYEVFPEIDDAWRQVHRRGLAGETLHADADRFVRQDGAVQWVKWDVLPWRTADGAVGGLIIATEDITRAKVAAEALQQSEELVRTIAENSTQGLAMMDERGYCIYANRAWLTMTGYTAEEIGSRPLHDLVHHHYPDGRPYPMADCPIDRALPENFDVRAHEDLFFRKDGSTFPVLCAASPVFRDGRPVATVIEIRDVSQSKAAEVALRESEARFRTLADNIAQLAWMADETGWIFWYNKRWFEYTGTTLAEMQGWGWQQVHHPDHVDAVTSKFRRFLETGEPWEDTFPLRGQDGGYRWFLSRAVPIRDASGRVVRWFGTNTDVTEQHEAQEALREAVRIREDFLSIASHELRTPLTSLELQLERIVRRHGQDGDRYPLPDWLVPIVQSLERQAGRLESLVVEMLDFSRVTAHGMQLVCERVDLRDVVVEVADRFKVGLENAGSTLTLVVPGPVIGDWDPSRLDQVVTNLLSNAIKYGSGSPITITAETIGNRARLTVGDLGGGIAPENQARIFQQFERLVSVRHFGGFGLGLWITRQIVEAMGGTVTVASQLGEGATFTVDLPLYGGCRPSSASPS